MEIENVKRVYLTDSEAQDIRDVIKMIDDIVVEFENYTHLEVFERLLDHYERNEGYVATEIDF
jgi:hypothetical protein